MFEYTEKEILNCKEEIETIRKALRSLPDGYLIRRRGYYYHCANGKTRGISKDLSLIRLLAQKAYQQRRLKYLETSLIAGEAFLAGIHNGRITPEDLIKSLSKTYQQLPMDCFFHTAETEWQYQPYETNPYHPEQRSIITDCGVAVRSKSELIIANTLHLYQIPFRYEAALVLGWEVKYPDFTIKRLADGKLIYWEHFGFMDNPGYRKKAAAKLQLYAENNIISCQDLICTTEEDIKDGKRIHHLINCCILQN